MLYAVACGVRLHAPRNSSTELEWQKTDEIEGQGFARLPVSPGGGISSEWATSDLLVSFILWFAN